MTGVVDLFSLVLILAAGLQLGLQGFFGWDAAGHFFGEYGMIRAALKGAGG